MKHEWKKHEKNIYLPKNEPELIEIPEFRFFMIEGEGNPNSEHFAEYIAALYAVSYAVRMSPKKNAAPEGYFEYTVYPLEGVWGLTDKGINEYDGTLDKDQLKFTLMIRQPDFVTDDFASDMIEAAAAKKKSQLINSVKFGFLNEGLCVQMLHLGPYDDEPASFTKMEQYCSSQGLNRLEKTHREIYLTDARKTEPSKLKTVLRFKAG